MAFIEDHKAKLDTLRTSLEARHRDQLRRKANGGNSILFTYPPSEERLYIKKAEEHAELLNLEIIDVAKLLVKFIDDLTLPAIERKYKIFKATPHKVFSSFIKLIIEAIKEADDSGKTPLLTRTGALYGTGIENVNIMEDKVVMSLNNPLVIFYPSKTEHDNLFFLNFKLASRYRCTVIE
tara:strand:+ start:12996 stop:13535 length:540 start_codon:yes stop_codon:yes gene_type:complete